ncbi:hypothetical protein LZ017_04765 [Pelomonas sp. CA6]|uniref:hypothetical protein n=1 Tax=Pelomonas sp. CA6 TaxID=2907999 RepID=UPI001F4B158C|nr:hypothetical protein [Pelomonas sp. CA6]MCH7342689.1 hypothetical protein [Pelomonas sp. CA6]
MPAQRIRVLIASIPDLLSGILASKLALDPEIEVLISHEHSALLSHLGHFRPQVVIAAADEAVADCEARPLQVYLLSPDARTVRHLELRPVDEAMDEVSLDQLLAAIAANKEG